MYLKYYFTVLAILCGEVGFSFYIFERPFLNFSMKLEIVIISMLTQSSLCRYLLLQNCGFSPGACTLLLDLSFFSYTPNSMPRSRVPLLFNFCQSQRILIKLVEECYRGRGEQTLAVAVVSRGVLHSKRTVDMFKKKKEKKKGVNWTWDLYDNAFNFYFLIRKIIRNAVSVWC